MRAALAAITETCARIHRDLVSGQASSERASRDVEAAERLVDQMLEQLRDAESLIDTEGLDALERAQRAQEQAGQQNDCLTQIAQEAQQLAKQCAPSHTLNPTFLKCDVFVFAGNRVTRLTSCRPRTKHSTLQLRRCVSLKRPSTSQTQPRNKSTSSSKSTLPPCSHSSQAVSLRSIV